MSADNPTLVDHNQTHDFWIPKPSQFYINHRLRYSNDDLQFCSETAEHPPGSGSCSPTLWSPIRTAPPENSQSLSPNSRTLAIARGQRELMEMIKNLPESSYELSLKDLVQDLPGLSETREDDDRRLTAVRNQEKVVVKRQESKKLLRTVSLDNNGGNGLFLKMVFPVSFRGTSRSRRKTTAMVPRPDCLDKCSKGYSFERDNWWKKRSSSSSSTSTGSDGVSSSHGSRSSGSGSDSRNSSRNNNERSKMSSFLPYCCSSSFIMAMATQREKK